MQLHFLSTPKSIYKILPAVKIHINVSTSGLQHPCHLQQMVSHDLARRDAEVTVSIRIPNSKGQLHHGGIEAERERRFRYIM